FSWKRVDETGDPSAGAHDDRFHDHIVKAREYIEAIAHSRNDGGYASYVAAGLLDCVEVGMLRQLFHLLRSDIRTVCDRIVVEHAREIRRFDYSAEVRAHLGPRALVHIRRQCHDTFTSHLRRSLGECNALSGLEAGDAGDDRHTLSDRIHARSQDLDFLVEVECCTFTKRPERNDAGAAVIYEPRNMARHEFVIDS